jgi:hypothetical protein
MQITVELNNLEDENLLLSLLQRLGIHYSIKKESVENLQQEIVMQAIEFEAKAHNSVIKIPDEYPNWNNKAVRVILLDLDREDLI